MTRETYRGVKLGAKVCKDRRDWGKVIYYVNGKEWGRWIGRSEDDAIACMRGYVDMAIERPGSSPDFEPIG